MVSSSWTWSSDIVQEKELWEAAVNLWQRHCAPEWPQQLYWPDAMLPWSLEEWFEHRAARAGDEHRRLQRAILARQQQSESSRLAAEAHQPFIPAFRGKVPSDGRGAVTSELTIWSTSEPFLDRPGAQRWPNQYELRYEGYDRTMYRPQKQSEKRSVGRFFPLVRCWDPGNDLRDSQDHSVAPRLLPLPFDTVESLPQVDFTAIWFGQSPFQDAENRRGSLEVFDAETMRLCLGSELLDSIFEDD